MMFTLRGKGCVGQKAENSTDRLCGCDSAMGEGVKTPKFLRTSNAIAPCAVQKELADPEAHFLRTLNESWARKTNLRSGETAKAEGPRSA